MDQNEYRNAKQTGDIVGDADQQQDEETTLVDDREEEIEQEEEDIAEAEVEQEESDDEDDLPPLNEKEKTAFEKRLEREKKKERERLEAELEQKYGRHKQVIEMLGGDPDAIERRIRDNQIATEAQRIAEANGWDDEQTRWYVEQQKQQNELKELRVQMQINKLRDNPDYAGIASMEKEILGKIDRSNGALTVEEAYWALGGSKMADQIRLDAQMREKVKGQKQARTVLTDSATPVTTEKPLPPDVVRDAERMGISAAEARRLMSKETVNNIDAWRERNKKAK
jgi:hypothetical protein